MHVGYAWMVLAFLLHGLSDLGVQGAGRAWLHAFTVGALGSMMLGLMTRVALRHTGRALVLPPAIVAAYVLIQLAALARVTGAINGDSVLAVTLSGAAWVAAFAIYLGCFGKALVSPSLPRDAVSPLSGDAQPLRRDIARSRAPRRTLREAGLSQRFANPLLQLRTADAAARRRHRRRYDRPRHRLLLEERAARPRAGARRRRAARARRRAGALRRNMPQGASRAAR